VIEGFDHIAIAVRDLDAAAVAYGSLLGRDADWIAEGAGVRLTRFQLSNMALVLVQPIGAGDLGGPAAARIGEKGEGIWTIGFATSDFEATSRLLARRGAPTIGEILAPDVGRLAFIDAAATHGAPLALVERQDRSAKPAASDAVQALDHVVVNTANADQAVALYGGRLGLDLRLDRSNPQWGSRLLFFRCGGAVVEIGARLGAEASDAPDRISGLAWRIADPDAAQARIAAAGFDVSEVRAGRKPGTKVFTVRSGVVGAPALMLSAEAGIDEA
jgi:catechol 2,3-dioxygenase-like lactoylglutathione lyase family enzyme